MVGHRQWSKVQRSEGILDSQRGQPLSQLAPEFAFVATMRGSDSVRDFRSVCEDRNDVQKVGASSDAAGKVRAQISGK